MKTFACRPCFCSTLALVALLASGCSDDSSKPKPASTPKPSATEKAGEALKQTGKDVADATKEVGNKMADGLAEAADGLETFAKTLASNVSETTQDVGASIKSKMPDLENLVKAAKVKLDAGGDEAKALGGKLDEKLATLRTKLDKLAADGANATKELKDEVVEGFRDLVASIKSGLAKLKA